MTFVEARAKSVRAEMRDIMIMDHDSQVQLYHALGILLEEKKLLPRGACHHGGH